MKWGPQLAFSSGWPLLLRGSISLGVLLEEAKAGDYSETTSAGQTLIISEYRGLSWGWARGGGGRPLSTMLSPPQAIVSLGHVARCGRDYSEMEFLGQNKETRCLLDAAKSH